MEIGLILKIAGIGLIVSFANIILSRSGRDEMAMLVSLGGIVVILLMLVTQISDLVQTVKDVFGL